MFVKLIQRPEWCFNILLISYRDCIFVEDVLTSYIQMKSLITLYVKRVIFYLRHGIEGYDTLYDNYILVPKEVT